MSAIAGIVMLTGEPLRPEEGGRLMRALSVYPADDVRTWQGGCAFLGCHAQWLTPESVTDRHPRSGIGRTIAADAVIDNRNELFDRLGVPLPQRQQLSDSDLILIAYDKWGTDAPRYLLGDYAFLIWDERERMLFGARDLTGNRTLYYHRSGNRIAFCTVIAPLLSLPGVPKKLNEQWLADFMANPEMNESFDPDQTAYADISLLPPAHRITVRGGKTEIDRCGTIDPTERLRFRSDDEVEEAFRDVFREAVVCRTRTCRKVGSMLSGGLDSGSVVSFAAPELRRRNEQLYTYSSVPDPTFRDWSSSRRVADETPYIRMTAEFVGNIRERYLDFAGLSPYSVIDDWLDILETPYKFFENSFWVKGIYDQARRDGAGVLLSGARGNFTISWGPALEYYALLLRRLRLVRLYREIRRHGMYKGVRRSRLIALVGRQALSMLGFAAGPAEPDMPNMILRPEFARKYDAFGRLARHGMGVRGTRITDPVELRRERLHSAAAANKSGAVMTKLSLRYGVQERDPTFDPRVIRFCLSLPFEQYVRQGMDRALIRRATKGYLPDGVRLNYRVRGIQGTDWVHRMAPHWPAFLNEIAQMCRSEASAPYLHHDHLRALAERCAAGPDPKFAGDPELKALMRALIIHRFVSRF